ncbi:MAG: glucose-6-phosphate isomerase [Candidatus Omnitrophica bacterium]|nr:glucose-6-phosphate isomerase [Candidatus Omnitrophota bacterium]
MPDIKLISKNCKGFVSAEELKAVSKAIKLVHKELKDKKCPGNDYIGWLNLPSAMPDKLVEDIEDTAKRIRKNCDVFISLGIGGSYLGARACIEFIKPNFANELKSESPKVYFSGHNLSSDYLQDLFNVIKKKKVVINVISKSGTTTETAVVFRILKQYMEKIYGKNGVKDRIIATTDSSSGALRKLAETEGYKAFIIPDDVGGRFSVLTPVGLLPIAVAGISIKELLKGARDFEKKCAMLSLDANPAYKYAGIRHILYKKGKVIEVLSSFHPSLRYLGEWWKQLFGESEGKDGKGIFPAACEFTTDLHSMGQMIQDGQRNIFETFLIIEKSQATIKVPEFKDNIDGLNYLSGKDLDYINYKAYEATAGAHYDGKVPNLSIVIPKRTAFHLGQLFYFFEKATAMSGLLSGVNPFNQPGVEAYKKKMFKLLGKPGA